MTLILVLIMTALITPIRVCFVDDEDVKNWYGVDTFFDVYFACDMIINFISAFYDECN